MFEALGIDLKGIGSEGVILITVYLIGEKTGLWALLKGLTFKFKFMQRLMPKTAKNGTRTQKIKLEKSLLCKDHGERIGDLENQVNTIENRLNNGEE